jgi:hypothetical protein
MSILQELKTLRNCPHGDHKALVPLSFGLDLSNKQQICKTCNNTINAKLEFKRAFLVFSIFLVFLIIFTVLASSFFHLRLFGWAAMLGLSAGFSAISAIKFTKID